MTRLRVRYAEIVARISERVSDPARREELGAQALRLSPDSWLTDDDVTRALDEYESVFAALRDVVGRKRRRRRRGRTSGSAEAQGVASVEGSDDREVGNSDDRELGDTDEGGQTNAGPDTSQSREEPEDPGL